MLLCCDGTGSHGAHEEQFLPQGFGASQGKHLMLGGALLLQCIGG
jgi:hypothetical protein